MNVRVLPRDERVALSEGGLFYSPSILSVEDEAELRCSVIRRLRKLENEDVFVSGFINRARLLFVDIEPPALTVDLIDDLLSFLAEDNTGHAVLVALFPERDEPQCILVSGKGIMIDEELADFEAIKSIQSRWGGE